MADLTGFSCYDDGTAAPRVHEYVTLRSRLAAGHKRGVRVTTTSGFGVHLFGVCSAALPLDLILTSGSLRCLEGFEGLLYSNKS